MRVGRGTLSFAMPDESGQVIFEPYVVKSGVSMAANLREAFKTADLLQNRPQRVRVVIDSPVLMVPVEVFDQDEMEVLYDHAFTRSEQDGVCYNVLPGGFGLRNERQSDRTVDKQGVCHAADAA